MIKSSSLYERVSEVLDFFHISKRTCAKEFGINQKTLGNNLSPEGEKNLWQHLPKLLDLFPRVSRQWLYFGEGPMLIGRGVPLDEALPMSAIADAVQIMGREAGGTNAALYRYIAGLPLEGETRETKSVSDAMLATAMPTPAIDKAVLKDVVRIFEEMLAEAGKSLAPEAKAEVICQLYQLVLEEEEKADKGKPARMFRIISRAMMTG